uniref:Flavin-containing monooxygenase n=1 Tax=Phallusia mammillata TaxID=59560 RepID=A0A6F9DD65_9ASCI|nr:dimethylaniline monooxygenase [N-oxide-forming] 2-like [Phallusia mammillata]
MAEKENICIIGAGPAGLATIKSCLEYGLTPVCYEKASDIGGLWNTVERKRTGFIPQIYESLVANVSKEGSCFSDFPVPKEWPPYLRQKQTLEYLRMYAEHFNLLEHVIYNTEVTSVRESATHDETGSWIVYIKTGKEEIEKEFRAVIVATGQLNEQIRPDIPGLSDKFKGEIISSGVFEANESFRDKSVVIIGCGHSGCDIAVECAELTQKIYISARHGAWLLPRMSLSKGLPVDLAGINRFKASLVKLAPTWMVQSILRSLFESRFDHTASGLTSQYPIGSLRGTVAMNDQIQIKIYSGQVKVKPGIKCFDEHSVTFEDGSKEHVDIVVVSTGYTSKFPFLPKHVIPANASDRKLHWWIFPIEAKHSDTLTFVGLIPIGNGPVNSTAELQSRYVAQVLSGERSLPSKIEMKKLWKQQRESIIRRAEGEYVYRVTILEYREELAKYMKLLPSFSWLLFTDPKLAFNVYFGPPLPYHFRLSGPHKWEKAREHSLQAIENEMAGMRSSSEDA